jgi:threonine dehydrogenase-like Zn-dependent dehydrogenase
MPRGAAAMAKATALVAPGRFEAVELPIPPVTVSDAVVRILACGICGSDIEQRRGHNFAGPVIPGHEPVGVIEEIGAEAARRWNVSAGDLVAIDPTLSCGRCAMCRAGRAPCEGATRRTYGFIPLASDPIGLMGGYAQYMHLDPATRLFRMEAGTPPALAAMYNPLGAGVAWTLKAGGAGLGDTVVVQGSGQRGLMCLIAARMAGARRVIMTDVSAAAWKLDIARRLGADHVVVADRDDPVEAVRELTDGRGAEVVLDVSGVSPKPVSDALDMVRMGGTIVLGAMKARREIPGFISDKLALKAATLRGVQAVDGDSYAKAVEIIQDGRFPLLDLHSHSLGLSEVDRAISLLAGEVPGAQALHVTIEP